MKKNKYIRPVQRMINLLINKTSIYEITSLLILNNIIIIIITYINEFGLGGLNLIY